MGFTLIELLVVMAIVSTVVSLLSPGLALSKRRARQIACLANANQLNVCVMLYADEHSETFPPSTDYSAPTSLPERIWTMKLIPYVQDTRVYVCPAAHHSGFASNWAERGRGSIGYSTATAYDPALLEGFATCTRVSTMECPSKSPLFGDTPDGPTAEKYRGYVFDPYNGMPNALDPRLGTPLVAERDLVPELSDLPPRSLKPLYARHDGRATLLFGDGHAQTCRAIWILSQERGAGFHWRFRAWPPQA